MAAALTGCRSGPLPPPSRLPADPGYQRVAPTGLRFRVDLPEGWSASGGSPDGGLRFRRPGTRWSLWLAERTVGEKENAARAVDARQQALLETLGGGSARVLSREEQRTGWLPGRLVQAEAKGGKELLVFWLGLYQRHLYTLAASGAPADQLEMREALDHAIATLRPR